MTSDPAVRDPFLLSAKALDRLVSYLAPIVLFLALVFAWESQFFHSLFGLGTFAVPLPSAVVHALISEQDRLIDATKETLLASTLGYTIGNGIGFAAASLLTFFPTRLARRAGDFFGALQALPIIAVAPIVALYFPEPLAFKTITVIVLVFPPTLVYVYRGMVGMDLEVLEFGRAANANRWQLYKYMRVPTAVPALFTALRYTTILTLVGVVLAELIRSRDGLGFEIQSSLHEFSTARAWAGVLILAVLGILSYILILAVERFAFSWSLHSNR